MPLMSPKPLPPRWVRRAVLAPAMVGLTVALLLTLPVWLLAAAAVSPLLPGRLRPLRVLWVVIVWLVLESACLMALFGLWVASGFGALTRTPPFQRVHYRLVGGYLWVFHRAATRVLGLRVEVEGPDPDEYRGHPLLVARSAWDEIPDGGLRELPARLVPCDDLGDPGDVDTPADLPERLRVP